MAAFNEFNQNWGEAIDLEPQATPETYAIFHESLHDIAKNESNNLEQAFAYVLWGVSLADQRQHSTGAEKIDDATIDKKFERALSLSENQSLTYLLWGLSYYVTALLRIMPLQRRTMLFINTSGTLLRKSIWMKNILEIQIALWQNMEKKSDLQSY